MQREGARATALSFFLTLLKVEALRGPQGKTLGITILICDPELVLIGITVVIGLGRDNIIITSLISFRLSASQKTI